MVIIMETTQKQYELTLILPPQLEGMDLENVKKEIEDTIAKFHGKIEFKELNKRDLAYPINKQGQGIYLISHLSIAPDNVNNLSKELKLNKKILRHLISHLLPAKPEIKKPKPSLEKIKKVKQKIKEKKVEESKVKLEEIDKKLDQIIEEI